MTLVTAVNDAWLWAPSRTTHSSHSLAQVRKLWWTFDGERPPSSTPYHTHHMPNGNFHFVKIVEFSFQAI